VADKVPRMLRILIMVWLFQVTIGVLLISAPPKAEAEVHEAEEK